MSLVDTSRNSGAGCCAALLVLLLRRRCRPWLARVKAVEVPCRGHAFPAVWRPVNSVRVVQGGGLAGLSLALLTFPLRVLASFCPGLTRRNAVGGNRR